LPILIGIVEAMAEPNFYVHDFGATPGLEPLVIVNGPIVKQLNFNYETAVMRVGDRPIPASADLPECFMRNMVGCALRRTITDKASIGLGMNVVLAENEDAVTEVGWTSFAEGLGFPRES